MSMTTNKNKTIVFDLDECLIKTKFESSVAASITHQKISNVTSSSSSSSSSTFQLIVKGCTARVTLRPMAKEVLRSLRFNHGFKIVLFTAGIKEYGEAVRKHIIDPDGTLVDAVFGRDACTPIQVSPNKTIYAKDLDIITGGNNKNIVLVENNIDSCVLQPANGLLVTDFQGNNPKDNALMYVHNKILKAFSMFKFDVRLGLSGDKNSSYLAAEYGSLEKFDRYRRIPKRRVSFAFGRDTVCTVPKTELDRKSRILGGCSYQALSRNSYFNQQQKKTVEGIAEMEYVHSPMDAPEPTELPNMLDFPKGVYEKAPLISRAGGLVGGGAGIEGPVVGLIMDRGESLSIGHGVGLEVVGQGMRPEVGTGVAPVVGYGVDSGVGPGPDDGQGVGSGVGKGVMRPVIPPGGLSAGAGVEVGGVGGRVNKVGGGGSVGESLGREVGSAMGGGLGLPVKDEIGKIVTLGGRVRGAVGDGMDIPVGGTVGGGKVGGTKCGVAGIPIGGRVGERVGNAVCGTVGGGRGISAGGDVDGLVGDNFGGDGGSMHSNYEGNNPPVESGRSRLLDLVATLMLIVVGAVVVAWAVQCWLRLGRGGHVGVALASKLWLRRRRRVHVDVDYDDFVGDDYEIFGDEEPRRIERIHPGLLWVVLAATYYSGVLI